MKLNMLLVAALVFLCGAGMGRAASSEPDSDKLVIYSPHDGDPLNAGIMAFMAKYPHIRVEVVAGGTGELCSRVRAEEGHPAADVLWGGGADSLEANAGLFEPYASPNEAMIDPKFLDPTHHWVGESPLPMVIMYNRRVLRELGVEPPSRWEDCLNPALKGRIAFTMPAKSGSAYTQLCTMLLTHGGSEKGWAFVAKFAENLGGVIQDSSGKCHRMVADGDYAVGITIEKMASMYRDDPDIGFIYPGEGTSAVPDAVAIVRNCPHPENARLFVDFVTSAGAQRFQSHDWHRRPSRRDLPPPDGLPATEAIPLIDYPMAFAASGRDQIISRFNALMGLR